MSNASPSSPMRRPDPEFPLPYQVTVFEVGPRDGLQMEPRTLATSAKVRLIDALSATGIRRIQVTSFVRPDAIPQLADAAEVMRQISRIPGIIYSALVPNARGAERALASEAGALDIVVSASDTHSLQNTRMTTAQAVEQGRLIARMAHEVGVPVCFGIATALGCPFEGPTPHEVLESLVGIAVDEVGAELVTIADTASMAGPRDVFLAMSRLRRRFPEATFSVHLHNGSGFGLANALAALEAGTEVLDSSVAGLGGCPSIPDPAGNVATEDLVAMLDSMGVETGVNLAALTEVAGAAAAEVGHSSSALLQSAPARRTA